MKKSILFLLVVLLTACGPSEAPKQANVPTVDELAADPSRLKELAKFAHPLEKVKLEKG